MLVVICGDQRSVVIDSLEGSGDELLVEEDGVGDETGNWNSCTIVSDSSLATQLWHTLHAIYPLVTHGHKLHEIKIQVAEKASMQRCLTMVNSNVRRLAMASAQVITHFVSIIYLRDWGV
jgi:hypothetical protein